MKEDPNFALHPEKNWATIDFRDAKYHGSIAYATSATIKEGPGILVLDNNTTIITSWHNDYPSKNNTLIITPEMNILELRFQERQENNYRSHRTGQEETSPQEWISCCNLADIYCERSEEFLLCGEKFEGWESEKWKWVVSTPKMGMVDNMVNMVYFEGKINLSEDSQALSSPQIMDEKEVTVENKKVDDNQNPLITLKLNKYAAFMAKVKSILEFNNKDQESMGYCFVCSETIKTIQSPKGQTFKKIITKIHSTHPNTIVITVSAIVGMQEDANSKKIENWGEYMIESVEFMGAERNLEFGYSVEKDGEVWIGRQILKYGDEYTYNFQENSPEAKRKKACEQIKKKEHLLSINFINRYHTDLATNIKEISIKLDIFWKESKKKSNLMKPLLSPKQVEGFSIQGEDIYLATHHDVKHELEKVKAQYGMSSDQKKKRNEKKSWDNYAHELVRRNRNSNSHSKPNGKPYHQNGARTVTQVSTGSLTFRTPIKNQNLSNKKSNYHQHPETIGTIMKISHKSHLKTHHESQYQRMERKRAQEIEDKINAHLIELKEIEEEKKTIRKEIEKSYPQKHAKQLWTQRKDCSDRKIGAVRRNNRRSSPSKANAQNDELSALATYYRHIMSKMREDGKSPSKSPYRKLQHSNLT